MPLSLRIMLFFLSLNIFWKILRLHKSLSNSNKLLLLMPERTCRTWKMLPIMCTMRTTEAENWQLWPTTELITTRIKGSWLSKYIVFSFRKNNHCFIFIKFLLVTQKFGWCLNVQQCNFILSNFLLNCWRNYFIVSLVKLMHCFLVFAIFILHIVDI